MNFRDALTQEDLKKNLQYDPETGIFTRKITTGGVWAGSRAGCVDGRGYEQIGVNGVQYQSHRLAWLYVHGSWPKAIIDHVNGDTLDNRIENLREATYAQNAQNRKANAGTSSGVKGVTFHKATNRWRAQCYVDGKQKHLGLFSNRKDAHEAYCRAALKEYGEFFNDGKSPEATS